MSRQSQIYVKKTLEKKFNDQHAALRCKSLDDVKEIIKKCKAEITRVEDREKGKELLIIFRRDDGRTKSIQFRKNRLPTKESVRKKARPQYKPRKGKRICDLIC